MTTASVLRQDPAPAAGILLLTHEEIGRALIAAAQHVMPRLPCQLDALEVGGNDDPGTMLPAAARAARSAEPGIGLDRDLARNRFRVPSAMKPQPAPE